MYIIVSAESTFILVLVLLIYIHMRSPVLF